MSVEAALQVLRKHPSNTTAWETIVLAVYQPLLVYVGSIIFSFRIVTARDSAHDIVHEVLLAFYEKWPESRAEIKSEAALLGYLKRSCRNLLIDKFRHEQHVEQFVAFLTLKFKDAFQDADPFKTVLLKEIIERMEPDCASLLTKFIDDDLSPADIADSEGELPATFYSRWYRCINKAKKIFSENLKKKEQLKR